MIQQAEAVREAVFKTAGNPETQRHKETTFHGPSLCNLRPKKETMGGALTEKQQKKPSNISRKGNVFRIALHSSEPNPVLSPVVTTNTQCSAGFSELKVAF